MQSWNKVLDMVASRPEAQLHLTSSGDIQNFVISGGPRRRAFHDTFHTLLKTRWAVLILLTFACYTLTVLLFAGVYALDPLGAGVGVLNLRAEHTFEDLFFFSVHSKQLTPAPYPLGG